MKYSNNYWISYLSSRERVEGNLFIQLFTIGIQPTIAGSIYIIPHLLTVAGDATAKSIGSKIIFIVLFIAMISPELRQSFLLSSSTVFIFSIQTASIGPSNTNHLRSESSFLANYLNFTANIPSYHSCETSSN